MRSASLSAAPRCVARRSHGASASTGAAVGPDQRRGGGVGEADLAASDRRPSRRRRARRRSPTAGRARRRAASKVSRSAAASSRAPRPRSPISSRPPVPRAARRGGPRRSRAALGASRLRREVISWRPGSRSAPRAPTRERSAVRRSRGAPRAPAAAPPAARRGRAARRRHALAEDRRRDHRHVAGSVVDGPRAAQGRVVAPGVAGNVIERHAARRRAG